jgi:hypothetical protein
MTQLTTVVPTGNFDPDAGKHFVIISPRQLSVTDGIG